MKRVSGTHELTTKELIFVLLESQKDRRVRNEKVL